MTGGASKLGQKVWTAGSSRTRSKSSPDRDGDATVGQAGGLEEGVPMEQFATSRPALENGQSAIGDRSGPRTISGGQEDQQQLQQQRKAAAEQLHPSSSTSPPGPPATPTVPPKAILKGHNRRISILQQNSPSSTSAGPNLASSAATSDNNGGATTIPTNATTKFAPLPDSSRKQFARDSGSSIRRTSSDKLSPSGSGGNGSIHKHGRPSSTDSLPLQRVMSHGRASILEMDLADAAMEPMSAHDMAASSMHEQAKRRRHGRHRRRYRTPSIASKQTKRTARSRAGKAIERIRRRRNSSSSSSSSSSSDSSSSSSSSGIDWRFWRSSTASSSTDYSYIPPEPTFTLYTPRLDGSLGSTQASESDLANLVKKTSNLPRPYTSKSSEQRDKSGLAGGSSAPVFDVLLSRTLNPCLDRLKEFWLERDQQEGIGGDIGASHLSVPKVQISQARRAASRAASRSGSPVPSHPATSRRTRGTGAAWWLDVQCASTADMRQLRRLIPMHPLTIEDILSQETREKIESYEQLGYYFVAFRALDETYFRYSESTSSSGSKLSSTTSKDSGSDPKRSSSWNDADNKGKLSPGIEEKDISVTEVRQEGGDPKQKRGIVEIVEGHKEGVEGAGVGAVNAYLVVFGDGIISFHFEDISKHSNRVKDRIEQFGDPRKVSSHWIAYGLMDSIVDTFFPLIDFIEEEARDIDKFLANPLLDPVEPQPKPPTIAERLRLKKAWTYFKQNRPHWLKIDAPSVGQFFGVIKGAALTTKREADFSNLGQGKRKGMSIGPKTLSHKALAGVSGELYDRGKMLTRIAVSRKLVMGLSRLLIPKNDVVRGMRKRLRDENGPTEGQPGQRHDIGIYLGDLQDHIISMQQTLHFFDTMLSHDHPAYLGILRLAYEAARISNDKAIVRLNIILVMFLPINIFCGIFSLNAEVPHNPLKPDGTPEHLWLFGVVIVALCIPIGGVVLYAYWAIRGTRKAYERKGVANRL